MVDLIKDFIQQLEFTETNSENSVNININKRNLNG